MQAYQKYKPAEFKEYQEKGLLQTTSHSGYIKTKHWFQFQERLNHDLLDHINSLSMPMLVIVGDQDTSCPAEHQNIFFDALPHKENKQLIILENQQHNFYTEADCDVLTAAISKYLHDYYHASL